MKPEKQCAEKVYKSEEMRRTGRGPTGFERHFTSSQCTRRATHGEYCWQHDPEYHTLKWLKHLGTIEAAKREPNERRICEKVRHR
jgi:hypothetical protein